MLQGTVLPGPAPKAAEIAAPSSGRDSPVAALGGDASEGETSSFATVLNDKLQEEANAAAPAASAANPEPAASASQEAMSIDPALQALFAALQSAAVVPASGVMLQSVAQTTKSADSATELDVAISSGARGDAAARTKDTQTLSTDATSKPVADTNDESADPIQFADPSKLRLSETLELKAKPDVLGKELLAANDSGRTRPSAETATQPNAATHTSMPVAPEQRNESAAPVVRVNVPAEMHSAKWSGAFAERVTWITQGAHPSAELQLNPPQLGPVEVRVSVDADQQTSLSFFSPNAAVREAIQAAIPKLLDSFSASGLTLGNVFVGAESQSQAHTQGGDQRGGGQHGRGEAKVQPAEDLSSRVTWIRSGSLGSIDLFA